MRLMTLSALASSWLFLAPAVWPHTPGKAALSASVGLLTMMLSPMGIVSAAARTGIAVAGLLLGLSNFVLYDSIGILANDAVVGLCLIFAGLGPAPRSTVVAARGIEVVPAASSSAARAEAPAQVTEPSIAA